MSTLPDAPDPHAKPKLRRGLSAVPVDGGVVLADQVRLGRPVQLTLLGLELARRFDGRRTLRDIQAELMLVTGGSIVPLDVIATLAAGLDEALLLDSPRF